MVRYRFRSIIDRRIFVIQILPIILFWLIGMILGAVCAQLTYHGFSPYLRASVLRRVSFLGLMAVHGFPIILSVLIVRFNRLSLFYPLAAGKAFCFSFCLCAVRCCFGSAGWLVRWLLMFSDSCMLLPLTWLWLRCVSCRCATFKRDVVICSAISAVICIVDYFVVSPFLVSLFYYS